VYSDVKSGRIHFPGTFCFDKVMLALSGSCHKRQKPQAPTPQERIRNRQIRKIANAKGLNRNTNLT